MVEGERLASKLLWADLLGTKLRQVEVPLIQGKTISVVCNELGTTETSSGMYVSFQFSVLIR